MNHNLTANLKATALDTGGQSEQRGNVTTTLTTKGAYIGVKYTLRRTDYRTGLFSLDAGGPYTVELEPAAA
jgi:hypothetical protein